MGKVILAWSDRHQLSFSAAFMSRGRNGGLDIAVGLKLIGAFIYPNGFELAESEAALFNRSQFFAGLNVGLNENSILVAAELTRSRFMNTPRKESLGAEAVKSLPRVMPRLFSLDLLLG